jgi:RNA polymerase sigma-70 factor, ECF subfamily
MHDRTPATDAFVSALPSRTSPSLIDGMKCQDPGAWRRLVRLYAPLVFLWCRRAGLRRDDAADVMQEVWIAVATHIAGFRRERPGDSFRGWLWTITRNKIRDRMRSSEPSAAGGTTALGAINQLPDDLTDSSQLVPNEEQILVRRALDIIRPEFEERTWTAFWRAAVDQRSAIEVAAELGIGAGAVRQANYRVRQRLREELDGLLG